MEAVLVGRVIRNAYWYYQWHFSGAGDNWYNNFSIAFHCIYYLDGSVDLELCVQCGLGVVGSSRTRMGHPTSHDDHWVRRDLYILILDHDPISCMPRC